MPPNSCCQRPCCLGSGTSSAACWGWADEGSPSSGRPETLARSGYRLKPQSKRPVLVSQPRHQLSTAAGMADMAGEAAKGRGARGGGSWIGAQLLSSRPNNSITRPPPKCPPRAAPPAPAEDALASAPLAAAGASGQPGAPTSTVGSGSFCTPSYIPIPVSGQEPAVPKEVERVRCSDLPLLHLPHRSCCQVFTAVRRVRCFVTAFLRGRTDGKTSEGKGIHCMGQVCRHICLGPARQCFYRQPQSCNGAPREVFCQGAA